MRIFVAGDGADSKTRRSRIELHSVIALSRYEQVTRAVIVQVSAMPCSGYRADVVLRLKNGKKISAEARHSIAEVSAADALARASRNLRRVLLPVTGSTWRHSA